MDTDIKIYAKGKAFESGVYDLRTLEIIISSYRTTLDKLIAVQMGRTELPKKSKKQLNYNVKINEGSIVLLIDFILEHPETIGLVIQDSGYQLAKAITELYRNAINLRHAAAKFIEKGLNFSIKINNSFNFGSNNSNVAIQESEIIIPDPKILFAAQATKYSTDKILSKIDGEQVEFVDFSTSQDNLKLDKNSREIMGKDKQVLPASLKIVGRLDMIAFSSHRGIVVSDNEKFPVTWDEKIRSKMQKMADKEGVIFTVNPVIDNSRLDNNAIGFHVLDCSFPQSSINL